MTRQLKSRTSVLLAVVAVLVSMGLVLWFWCGQSTTMVIVRHADRDGPLDALNAAGMVRAQELVHVGIEAEFAAIYHSDTNRARDTAAPLAAAAGLAPIVYPANEVQSLVASIFADHRGEKVLVIGHSNTIPDIIEAAGGPVIPNIGEAEFDKIFVLTVCRCGRKRVTLLNLQYGAVSP